MKRIFIMIMVCLFYCTGCTPPPPQAPVWETVQFKDLKRAKHSPQSTLESPLQFNLYIFSLPAGTAAAVKDVWPALSTKPIQFISRKSFAENGFAAGVGTTTLWEPIAEKLRAAGGKNLKTTDLVMFPGNPEYVSLLSLETEKNIFYRTEANQISGATLGPGEATLRLTAVTPPDVRGICTLTIEPGFKSTATARPALADANDLAFTAASLSVSMASHDWLLLGPTSFSPKDMTLGSVFFSSPATATVQLYLIVCAGVSN